MSAALPDYATQLEKINQYWNFKQLCQDLASHKSDQTQLSPKEEELLTEFLLGYTPKQVAEKTHRADCRSISTSRSNYLYPLIKALIQKVTAELVQPASPRTLILLEQMGYRKDFMSPSNRFDNSPRLPATIGI